MRIPDRSWSIISFVLPTLVAMIERPDARASMMEIESASVVEEETKI